MTKVQTNNQESIEQLTNAISQKSIQSNRPLLKNNNFQYDSQQKLAQLQRYRKDTELKESLANFVKIFTALWSLAIVIVLFMVAKRAWFLSDTVIITMLTETLLQTLGLATIVVSHFFPKENKQENNKENEI